MVTRRSTELQKNLQINKYAVLMMRQLYNAIAAMESEIFNQTMLLCYILVYLVLLDSEQLLILISLFTNNLFFVANKSVLDN